MAAIVTVYKRTSGTEADRLVNELVRWADAADQVSFERDALVGDLKFSGGTDPGKALRMVEDVLGAASVTWAVHIGVEAVSA